MPRLRTLLPLQRREGRDDPGSSVGGTCRVSAALHLLGDMKGIERSTKLARLSQLRMKEGTPGGFPPTVRGGDGNACRLGMLRRLRAPTADRVGVSASPILAFGWSFAADVAASMLQVVPQRTPDAAFGDGDNAFVAHTLVMRLITRPVRFDLILDRRALARPNMWVARRQTYGAG